jgi:outer membrane protein
LIEVLDAQKDYSNQQQGRTKARYDYVLNLLRLKASAGVITSQDINKVNSWLTIKGPA